MMHDISLRRLFLILLIVVSLLLTYAIFSQDTIIGTEEQESSTTTSPITSGNSLTTDANAVFGPSRIVKYEEDRLEMVNPRLFEEEIIQYYENFDFNQPEYAGNTTINQILVEASSEPSYLYVYDEPVAFDIYSQMFSDFPEELSNMSFDYVLLPLFSTTVYFYNSQTQDLYTSETDGEIDDVLETVITENDIPQIQVSQNILGNKAFYLPINAQVVPYKDYFLNRLPNSLFVDILFENPEDVNVRSQDNGVQYNDYYSEMFINTNTYEVSYNRQQYSNNEQDLEMLIEEGYRVMNRVENWPNGVHFSNINYDNQSIFFRRYIDGYPLFAENYEDGISLQFSGTTLIGLNFNANVAQIPIEPTTDNYEKTLPNGEVVLDMLSTEVEDLNLIENIRIGYEWVYNEESSRVAHFEPYWFYRYNGDWHKLDDANIEDSMPAEE